MVESHFSDRPMIVSGIGNGVVVPGRVYDDDAPVAMVRQRGKVRKAKINVQLMHSCN